MAVNIWDKPNSPQVHGGQERSATRYVMVEGIDNYEDARMALLNYLPWTMAVDGHNLVRRTPDVQQVEGHDDLWDCVMEYGKPAYNMGDLEFEFKMGGGTATVTQALSCVSTNAAPGFTPPAVDGRTMGITSDGMKYEVHGAEIYVPSMHFNIKFRCSSLWFTTGRRLAIARCMAAPVNLYPFFGYSPGEILFLGCDGGYRTRSPYGEMNFEFAMSPNKIVTIGNIPPFYKKGWDRVEILYRDGLDEGTGLYLPQVVCAWVQKVYYDYNFSVLGIGGV